MSEGDILAYEAEKYARRIEVSPGTRPGTALAAQIEREGGCRRDAARRDGRRADHGGATA